MQIFGGVGLATLLIIGCCNESAGGNIRKVVGIDIDYKDKSATLSIWQPRLQANEASEEELVRTAVARQDHLHSLVASRFSCR